MELYNYIIEKLMSFHPINAVIIPLNVALIQ